MIGIVKYIAHFFSHLKMYEKIMSLKISTIVLRNVVLLVYTYKVM